MKCKKNITSASTENKIRVSQTLRISGVTWLGPTDENEAMNGAGLLLIFAVGAVIYPNGSLLIQKASK